jgi:glycine/D-amino acid oxidase-like deaminating enzyme
MKKAAIIGAGFAGLAAAYFLSEKYQVTLFDQKGIGAGASGISSGLLHPYPGEKGRLSWHAEEALTLAKKLIDEAEEALGRPVAHRGGILRLGPILNPGSDVVELGPEKFLITSGMTVYPSLYLQGLWRVCEKKGVVLNIKKIESLESLKGYDCVVLAIGAGIRSFKEKEDLKINFVKGQVLTCALEDPLERSVSSKVYTALTELPLQCHVGATYERDVIDEIPDQAKAVRLLNPALPVLDCRAGIRVTNPAHYFPILQQIGPHHHAITALGSRGLLYHALMGSNLLDHLRNS